MLKEFRPEFPQTDGGWANSAVGTTKRTQSITGLARLSRLGFTDGLQSRHTHARPISKAGAGMESTQLAFTHVTERDMDLLLVEELKCSAAFREWFLGKFDPEMVKPFLDPDTHLAVRHSVERAGEGYGETDIEVALTLHNPLRRLIVFIEDKITAPFTPNQPQRYRLAAQAARREGKVEFALTVLLAPSDYLGHVDASLFDLCVPYEALAEFFLHRAQASQGELSARCHHRLEIVEHAVGKHRRGYQAVADPRTTDFWRSYYLLASARAPQLSMEDPSEKPTFSMDIYFKRALPLLGRLRKPWLLKHSLENQAVMIEVSQWGKRFEFLEPLITEALEPGMVLRQAGKSIQIRLTVPHMNPAQPFDGQVTQASEGIKALVRLRDWYLRQAGLVDQCQPLAEPSDLP